MPSLARIAKYTLKNSVGNNPETDYQIGVKHGVVGCGSQINRRDFHWFTIVNKKLIYNGLLGEQIYTNPWAASGNDWKVYTVKYHHVLGDVDTVLATVGIDQSVIDVRNFAWVKKTNNAAIQRLIDYALTQVAS